MEFYWMAQVIENGLGQGFSAGVCSVHLGPFKDADSDL